MEDSNILSKGVYILYEIKDDLVKNNGLKTRSAQLNEDEKRYSKQLDTTKKAEASEINQTIAKRRSDIESSFSTQLGQARTQMKKVQARRTTEKNNKISKRIKNETEDLREEIRSNKEDIKSVFSRNDIPGIFNNGFFYSIFTPKSAADFGIIGLTLLAILLVPLLICLFVLPQDLHTVIKTFLYIVIVTLLVGCYILIRKKVLIAHKRDFKEIGQYRNKIKSLKRRIAKKEQNIRKDPNESGYELDKFDVEINDIQKRIDTIVEEKKNAMTVFETKTKLDIADKIRARYVKEIEEDQKALDSTREEKHSIDEEINELSVKISKNYEPYLGKDVLTPLVIDSLIDIIDNGNAETVAEAIDYYKKEVDKSIQLN